MKALRVAKYIINKSIDFGKPISPLTLQKFMYFVHLEFLRKTGEKLITDEDFEAWQWGPVIRSVYEKFKIYGGFNLTIHEEGGDLDLRKYELEVVDKYIKVLLKWKPWELVERTHNSIAWLVVWQDGAGNKRKIWDRFIELEANNGDVLESEEVKEALRGVEKAVKIAAKAIENEIKDADVASYKMNDFLSNQWKKNDIGKNMKKAYKNERTDAHKLDDLVEEILYAHFIQSENIQKAFENIGATMYNVMKEFDEKRDLKQTEQKASSKSKTTRAWWKIWK